jgi:hypothetical protein
MRCTAQEMVDAIIDAAARRGADGRGQDALDGHMFMLARTSFRRFGILLGEALRLKMKPGHVEERPEFGTREEVKTRLREAGLPESVLDYLTPIDRRTQPSQRERARPNGTRAINQAIIKAAIRHGRDGHGKDGLRGYMMLLERADPVTFNMLMRVAQRWQVKHPPPKPKRQPALSPEECRAILEKCCPTSTDPDPGEVIEYPDPEDCGRMIDVTPSKE